MPAITEEELRARIAELNDRIGLYELALAYARKEREKVEIAVEVVGGFHERPRFPAPVLPPSVVDEPARRPAGGPTIPLMIRDVLEAAAERGVPGLEPKTIIAEIRDSFWADAPSNSIRSTLWRLLQERRLAKVGSLYALAGAWSRSSESGAVAAGSEA